MKKSYKSLFGQYLKYQKLYKRLHRVITDGSFWRYSGAKRRMLFKRLRKLELRLGRLSDINWRQLAIPAVSGLAIMATKGSKAKMSFPNAKVKEEIERIKMFALSMDSVDAYSVPGTVVGQLTGGPAPYTFVDGEAGGEDNSLFTIVNGDSLVVNANIWAVAKDQLSIRVQDMGGAKQTIPVYVKRPDHAGPRAFNQGPVIPQVSNSLQARAGHLDDDGNLDMVVMNADNITIYSGNGDHSFTQIGAPFDLGATSYYDIELGDIDGDGDIDIVVGGIIDNTPVILNQFVESGSGFTTPNVTALDTLQQFSLADIDDDGDLDVVARQRNNFEIIENVGGANLFQKSAGDPGISGYGDFDLGDIDNNGDLDFVLINDYNVTVFYGNPVGGNFSGSLNIRSGQMTYGNDLKLADIDNDGDLDMFMATGSYGAYYHAYINPLVYNAAPGWQLFGNINNDYKTAEVADLDGDGDLDLIMERDGGYVRLLLNDSAGVKVPVHAQGDLSLSNATVSAIPGDFDGDGDLDLFMVNASQFNSVLINDLAEISISNSTVNYFGGKGEPVGILSGSANQDYKLIADTSANHFDADNSYFTILNGDSLVINDELWTSGKSSFSILVSDTLVSQHITLIPDGFPTATGFRTLNETPTTFGNGGRAIATGDIDGDGINDIITLTATSAIVDYFDGAQPNDTISTGTNNHDIELGDFDGDGNLDIIIGGDFPGYGDQSLFFNNGGGSGFTANTPTTMFYYDFTNIEVGDLDDDGDLDIVAATNYETTVFLGDGTGHFSVLPTDGVSMGGSLDLGDADGDGDLDLLIAGASGGPGGLLVFNWDEGLGRFNGYSNLAGGFNTAFDAQFADIDLDGDLDVVGSTDRGPGHYAAVFENEYGTGFSYGNPTSQYFYNAYDRVWANDYDHDGDIDIILQDTTGLVHIHGNDFGKFTERHVLGAPGQPADIAFVDVSGTTDDAHDLVMINSSAPNHVYENIVNNPITAINFSEINIDATTAKGKVAGELSITDSDGDTGVFEFKNDSSGIHNAYFTIDGDSLLVNGDLSNLFDENGNRNAVLFIRAQDGRGAFLDAEVRIPLANTPDAGGAFTDSGQSLGGMESFDSKTVDLHNDGYPDIVIAGTGAGGDGVVAIINNTSGGITTTDTLKHGGTITDFQFGDVDGDGDTDIVVGSQGSSYYPIWKNNNDGTFSNYSGPYNPQSIQLADLDSDGDLDMVALSVPKYGGGLELFAFVNNGSGYFNEEKYSRRGDEGVLFADVDNDGDLDWITRDNTSGIIEIRTTNTDFIDPMQSFEFSLFRHQTLTDSSGLPAMGDIDGDGDIDLISTSSNNPVYLNDGYGTFTSTSSPFNVSYGGVNEIADLDGDGDLDLILDDQNGTFNVAWNDGAGSFSFDGTTFGYVGDSYDVALGDLDLDGDLDVFLANNQFVGPEYSPDRILLNENFNSAPTLGTNTGLTLNEHDTLTVTSAMLQAVDAEQTDLELLFTLTQIPQNGHWQLSGTDLSNGQTFTQDDINNSLIRYIHDGTETIADSIRFDLTDGLLSLTDQQVDIAIAPVNDLLVEVNNNLLTLREGKQDVIISPSELQFSDVESSDSQITFTLTALPTSGTVFLSGSPLGISGTFTQQDINEGNVAFSHDDSENTSDSFTFDVEDADGGSISGEIFNFSITPKFEEDAPIVTVNAIKTNSPSPEITGTIDDETASFNVEIEGFSYFPTISAGTWQVDSGTINTLSEGTYNVLVNAVDSIDNVTNFTEVGAIIVDLTPPTLTIDALTDTEINSSEATTVEMGGETNAEFGQNVTVTISDGTNTLIFTPPVLVGTWALSADISTLDDGAISIDVDVTDEAGNSAPTVNSSLNLDQTAPTIAIDALVDSNINESEASSVSISGSTDAEDGQTVTLTISDGTTTLNPTATVSSGTWSLVADISTLDDGLISIDADVDDVIGNSATTASTSLTLDQTDPTIAIDVLADNNINTAEASSVSVSGTTDAEDGQTVTLTISDGTTTLNPTATVSSGTWSLVADISALDDGLISIDADVDDVIGNSATTASTSLTLDQTDPTIAIDVLADNSINTAEASSVSVSGTTDAEDGQTVTLTISDGTTTLNPTATVSSGTWSLVADISTLDDGLISIDADVDDVIGNSATTASTILTLDQTDPTIAIDVLADNSINTAEASSVSVSGTTDAEDGQTVTLTISDGTTTLNPTATVSSGTWSLVADISTLDDGLISIDADVDDVIGNSATTASTSLSLDQTDPTIAIDVLADNSINTAEASSVSISGTTDAEDGQTVTLTISDGTTTLNPTATVSSGTWSLVADISTLDDGLISIDADVDDVIGNSATTVSTSLTLDQTDPTIAIDVLADNSINTAEASSVSVSGTTDAEDGQTVTLTISDGTTTLNPTATVSSGTWSLVADISTLDDGLISIDADVDDVIGNSATTASTSLTLDQTDPTISIDVLADNNINAAEASSVSISGTTDAEDGQTVTLIISDGITTLNPTATVSSGTWSLVADISTLDDGLISIDADVDDIIGNSATTASTSLTLDQTDPTISIDVPADNNINAAEASSVSVSGTTDAEDGQTVTLTISDGTTTLNPTATVSSGTWSLVADISTLDDGLISIDADVDDVIGNSATTASTSLTLDQTDPTIAIDVLADNSINTAEASSVSISGTTDAEDGQTVTLIISDGLTTLNPTATVSSGTWSLVADISTLDDGLISIDADVDDVIGNSATSVSTSLTLDQTDPTIAIDVLADNNINAAEASSVSMSGTTDAEDGQTVTLTISDGTTTLNPTATVSSGTWSLVSDISTLDDGLISIDANVDDVIGNSATTASSSLTLDQTAPSIGVDVIESIEPSPELTGSIDDPTAIIEITVLDVTYDGINNADGSWVLEANTIDPLDPGIYEVMAEAKDTAGNTSIDLTTFELTITSSVDPNRSVDSTALVNIYNITNGASWSNSSGWLTQNLENWHGVTITDDRVTTLNLSNNNLSGTFPAIDDGLGKLASLNLAQNELLDVSTPTSTDELSSIDISQNRIQFETITRLQGVISTVTYSEQKEVLSEVRSLNEIGDTYTVDRTVAGGVTYKWFRNGEETTETTSTFEVTIEGFEDEALYFAEVTNSEVPGLTLTTTPVDVRVSSLERDSTSLILVYDAVVSDQSSITDWPNTPIANWPEVEISESRVISLDLSNQNLKGDLPSDILDVAGLQTINISGNDITSIPELSSLENLTQFDASSNELDFSSIEPNVDIAGFEYGNQGLIGEVLVDTIAKGSNYTLTIESGSSEPSYQWNFKGEPISGATSQTYNITGIDYESMGDYTVSVSSGIATDLTLESETQTVLAYGNIEFFPNFSFSDGTEGFVGEGVSRLFLIKESGPYDTAKTVNIENERLFFEKIVLGDYLLNVRTEPGYTIIKEGVDTVEFIPTYYESVIEWDSADVLELREFISDKMLMQRIPPPLDEGDGDGTIGLVVESDFEDDPNGRLETRRRVKKAGCSLRRKTQGGGGRTNEDIWELIAYAETDDNGTVNFGFLPEGTYRLNIQYPGVPMDESTFVEFIISDDEEQDGYELAATVTEDGIFVEVVEELGFYRKYFKELRVYPNPASDVVTVAYDRLNSKTVKVDILDIQGRIVKTQNISKGRQMEIVFDVSDLNPGMYMLHFYDPDEDQQMVVTHKLLIRR